MSLLFIFLTDFTLLNWIPLYFNSSGYDQFPSFLKAAKSFQPMPPITSPDTVNDFASYSTAIGNHSKNQHIMSLMLRAPLLPPLIFCSSTVVRLGWVHLCVSVFCDSNARGITTAFPVKCLFCKLHYYIYGSELKCFFRLKCFELSFNICSLHYISKFSPRVRLHYEKRKMKTQQTPTIYPPMLASGLFKQGNSVEKVTLNLLQRQASSRHCHERKEKGCF
ncbi:uncharacterized protein LOC130733070 isoform X2 [Lotus japonicus]|uniref:uncharacterized protein LOC130733070 isoform X2 n=1 Tax=Lotus japonicus TaxID=34305 RepID=UPI0025852141|nr:uncharacterized protein LOC130733070 isoform X2 [Lotus japonicus]